VTLRQIREHTEKDSTLKMLSEMIHKGNVNMFSKEKKLKPFQKIFNELTLNNGIIIRL